MKLSQMKQKDRLLPSARYISQIRGEHVREKYEDDVRLYLVIYSKGKAQYCFLNKIDIDPVAGQNIQFPDDLIDFDPE
jgi:hypothetical protein